MSTLRRVVSSFFLFLSVSSFEVSCSFGVSVATGMVASAGRISGRSAGPVEAVSSFLIEHFSMIFFESFESFVTCNGIKISLSNSTEGFSQMRSSMLVSMRFHSPHSMSIESEILLASGPCIFQVSEE